GVRARTEPAGVRPAADSRDERIGRRGVVLGAGHAARDEPAVPPSRAARRGARARDAAEAERGGGRCGAGREPMSRKRRASTTSRRHVLRGLGAALTLPWMESLPAFAQEATGGPKPKPPVRLGILY